MDFFFAIVVFVLDLDGEVGVTVDVVDGGVSSKKDAIISSKPSPVVTGATLIFFCGCVFSFLLVVVLVLLVGLLVFSIFLLFFILSRFCKERSLIPVSNISESFLVEEFSLICFLLFFFFFLFLLLLLSSSLSSSEKFGPEAASPNIVFQSSSLLLFFFL